MAQDIFDAACIDSLVRKIFRERGELDLQHFSIPTYKIRQDYTVVECQIDQKTHGKDIRRTIEPIIDKAESMGYSHNLFTAVYEAVLNAYQHGNKMDPNKKVTIAYKIGREKADIVVMDEGGVLDPEFVPFVLHHREGQHTTRFLDFYKFTGREKPEGNNGTGTSFMHTYVDTVSYFKSPAGGLVVQLTKKAPTS